MTTYTAVLDNSKTNVEGHSKFLNRFFGPGVPTGFNATSMQVVQRGAGANMSVDISIGDTHLERPTQDYSFWAWQDAISNVVITTAPATNSRIDAIVAYVDTSVTTTASNNSPGSLKFIAIVGTVAGSPVAPLDAAIQTTLGSTVAWTRLANVTVGTSVTSIVTANIADTRKAVGARIQSLLDPSGNSTLLLSPTASAVNQLTVANAATGNGPTISATGSDTNVDINLLPKGTGYVKLNYSGAPVQTVTANFAAVATGTNTIPLDDTIPQITEGTEFMTCSITPKSATNILEIFVYFSGSHTATNTNLIAALFQDSGANALAASQSFTAATTAPLTIPIEHAQVAGTTATTTFRVRAGAGAASTVTFNGQSGARLFGATTKSAIVIREYKA